MGRSAGFVGRAEEDLAQGLADRVAEGHVGHDAVAEEGGPAGALRAVDELVDEDDVAGDHLLLQGANRADADDPGHTQHLHAEDVGGVVHLARGEAMAAPVTGQEDHLDRLAAALEAFDPTDDVRVTGVAEGRLDALFVHIYQPFHLVEATAPNDTDPQTHLSSSRALLFQCAESNRLCSALVVRGSLEAARFCHTVRPQFT